MFRTELNQFKHEVDQHMLDMSCCNCNTVVYLRRFSDVAGRLSVDVSVAPAAAATVMARSAKYGNGKVRLS